MRPELFASFAEIAHGTPPLPKQGQPPLWSVNCNRPVEVSLWHSALAVKADAARRLFDISCEHLTWAVIDTGIDARHPAFRYLGTSDEFPRPYRTIMCDGKREKTRVIATYDFSRLRDLLAALHGLDDPSHLTDADLAALLGHDPPEETRERLRALLQTLGKDLALGRELDWDVLGPLLEVPSRAYGPPGPENDHGTHVAGILGANWSRKDGCPADHDVVGVCPTIKFYDLRVFDQEGKGFEFGVMAAMQFVRHLNAHRDYTVVHGVNLSLSIRHDVANYACGRTPVCEECNRLSASGVVVVAAAGNEGYARQETLSGPDYEYRSISITDPGNADSVITVGATHRELPHTYGVSYFSSRGPTGDGRRKPDLVAPGEKIEAPVGENRLDVKDGTSMAAPHVSGAAALLMARHTELAGNSARIKEILCATATDLGREPYFQGHGLVDVLRAIQSV
ncbi:MAG: S8 family serine peptidase [Candidatus Hydrogenedentes bacterium]|nr:S8 family serine peptidase [Candidatus Hydrogenedentota bacterium]